MGPLEWAIEVLGYKPWGRQCDVLRAAGEHKRVTVRSGHGVGKTDVAALLACWFIAEHNPSLVITTAPTFKQVEKVLWAAIHRFWAKTIWAKQYEGQINKTEITLTANRRALGLSTNEPERFQGYHCENLLVICDEACGVSEDIYEAMLGLLTGENNRMLLIGNPTVPSGFFYRSHLPGSGFEQLHISALESPNYAEGCEVIPGLTTRQWVEERREDYGEDSPFYKSRVLGEFPDQGENVLIARSWIEAANQRDVQVDYETDEEGKKVSKSRPVRMGVDVARFGNDKTAFVLANETGVLHAESHQGWSTMQTAGAIRALAREWRVEPSRIAVDDTGVGGGVTDRLHEQNFRVQAVNFGSRANDAERYADQRTEMYANLASSLNPKENGRFALPKKCRDLAGQLAGLQYSFTSRGQMKLESKDDIKSRLGHSPDEADALALCFVKPEEAPRAWLL